MADKLKDTLASITSVQITFCEQHLASFVASPPGSKLGVALTTKENCRLTACVVLSRMTRTVGTSNFSPAFSSLRVPLTCASSRQPGRSLRSS